MVTIALLGASGPSGMEVLKDALHRDITVRAIVRDPSKITIENPKLEIRKANIFDKDSLIPIFEGCDAVLSCLGGAVGFSRVTLYSDSIKAVTEAMRSANVKKIVVMSAAMCKDEPSHPFWVRYGLRLVIGRLLDDMVRMENYLRENCQDLNFVAVRPPGLKNGPKSDAQLKTEESMVVKDGAMSMPRANVASFMLDCLETQENDKKFIAIAL